MTPRRAWLAQDVVDVRLHPKAKGVTAAFVRRAVQAALKAQKAGDKAVSVYVTTDREIRAINKKHLKHDYATDVISFGAEDDAFLGDIVISSDFAKAYSKAHSVPFKEEVARYLVHGALHLLGYDDRDPRSFQKMHRRQERILVLGGFAKPAEAHPLTASRSAGDGGRRPRASGASAAGRTRGRLRKQRD